MSQIKGKVSQVIGPVVDVSFENAENLPKRKLKLPWGVDSDKLVQKVLHDLKTRGAPYELLESVQGIH